MILQKTLDWIKGVFGLHLNEAIDYSDVSLSTNEFIEILGKVGMTLFTNSKKYKGTGITCN